MYNQKSDEPELFIMQVDKYVVDSHLRKLGEPLTHFKNKGSESLTNCRNKCRNKTSYYSRRPPAVNKSYLRSSHGSTGNEKTPCTDFSFLQGIDFVPPEQKTDFIIAQHENIL